MDDAWRERLKSAISKSDKSMRAISQEAGHGAGYVYSLFKEGKTPSIENLIEICKAANTSASFVLFGYEMDGETEEILSLIGSNPEMKEAILQILRNRQAA